MIEVEGLTKRFSSGHDETLALADVSLRIEPGQFCVLLGPSGSGKTTMLRSIAGLETPDEGSISIDGWKVMSGKTAVPPERRPIGMVFQSYALWPTMNVFQNVALPLRHGARGIPKSKIADRVGRVLDVLQLAPMARRSVSALSGGQQQRVALARALALEPKVLLMDEPLSNLDVQLRAELRVEIKELTHRLGITTVYVTHDQADALVMADVVCVMRHGRIVQRGTVQDLYHDPADLFVGSFFGEMSRFPGTVVSVAPGSCVVRTESGTFTARHALPDVAAASEVTLGIRPEDITWHYEAGVNRAPAELVEKAFMGATYSYTFVASGSSFAVRRGADQESIEVGERVHLEFPASKLTAFAA